MGWNFNCEAGRGASICDKRGCVSICTVRGNTIDMRLRGGAPICFMIKKQQFNLIFVILFRIKGGGAMYRIASSFELYRTY